MLLPIVLLREVLRENRTLALNTNSKNDFLVVPTGLFPIGRE